MSFDGSTVRSVLWFIARYCSCDLGYRLLGQSAARRFGVEASMYRKSFDEGVELVGRIGVKMTFEFRTGCGASIRG